jgi:putative endonuclease
MEAAVFYVYIMTNRMYGTLYVGVTNDIVRRAWEHREALVGGFTKKYGLKLLVYYEEFQSISDAIHREKRLKHWNRAWKMALIEKTNPNWDDLYPSLAG